MRHIDMSTWPRREHFKLFSTFDHPEFSLCANVDLTEFYPPVKRRGLSFTVAVVYVLARAANSIPEFRYRIRGAEVVEHEVVHPSATFLVDEDLFTFCTIEYAQDFPEFARIATRRIAQVREHPTLEDEPGQDDLLFMTALPWVSFTSLVHPMAVHGGDSVPKIAWGRFFQDGEGLKMPLNLQAHHALMDGVHVGEFYAQVQDLLDHPGLTLGEA